MKPIVFALTVAFACVAGVSVSVQQKPTSSDQPAHKVFVLNGCLMTNPNAADAFKLTGAVPVGTAPPAGPAASAEPKGEYVLLPTTALNEQGVAKAEMQTHVGKKVEVTVRPVEVAPGPASSSSASTATAKVEETAPQRFTVTKITSATGSCPRA